LKEAIFTLRKPLQIPLDGSIISPDTIAEKSLEELGKIKIWMGNTRVEFSKIFSISEGSEVGPKAPSIRLEGDLSKVRRIGYRMTKGSILIEGNSGLYTGEEMSGGSIVINGDAGSWLGARMKGGSIEVKGNAGDYVGAAYRGSTKGMSGGIILIHGNAGFEVGCWMKGGIIRIKGSAGMFSGIHMAEGAILVEGNCEGRAGAQMKGGRIVVNGFIPSILPSFTFDEIRETVKVGDERVRGPFYQFIGDLNENGNGRLSIAVQKNPHLKFYERYLEA
jgi:formylmethanofuran dehydrogenase subunit C